MKTTKRMTREEAFQLDLAIFHYACSMEDYGAAEERDNRPDKLAPFTAARQRAFREMKRVFKAVTGHSV